MTKSLLIELGLSFVGVSVLVGISYLLGAWRNALISLEAAAERLRFDEPDFRPGEWLIGADGRSAAALSEDGAEIGLVFVMGDEFATRRLSRAEMRVERDGSQIVFALRELSRRAVEVAAPDEKAAKDWLLRLQRGGV